jgi:hypothetical protein
MRGIYDVRHWDGFGWHDIFVQIFMKIFRAILRLCFRNLRGCNAGNSDVRDLWRTLLRFLHVAWWKLTGVQGILRFFPSNLNGCNVGLLLMEMNYEVYRWDRLRWHDTNTKFHDDWLRNLRNIIVNTATIWEAVILELLIEKTYGVHLIMVLSCMMYVPSFMGIGAGIQAILSFSLRNLRCCNVGITEGRNL